MHQRAKECTNRDPHSLLRQWGWAVCSTWPEGSCTDSYLPFQSSLAFLLFRFFCLWHAILEKISRLNVFFRKYMKRQQNILGPARWVRGYKVKSTFSCVEFGMLTDLGSLLRRDEGQTILFSKGHGAQLRDVQQGNTLRFCCASEEF